MTLPKVQYILLLVTSGLLVNLTFEAAARDAGPDAPEKEHMGGWVASYTDAAEPRAGGSESHASAAPYAGGSAPHASAAAPYYLRPNGFENKSAEFVIDFKWDDAKVLPGYMQTGVNLQALSDSLASIGIDAVDSLAVVSYSSPEGQFLYNLRLAERRAKAAGSYLTQQYPQLKDRIGLVPDGESWHLFRERTLTDTTITEEQREKLLSIIDSGFSPDRKKVLIKNYSPQLYRRIVRQWFPSMRRSFIRLDWREKAYEKVETIASLQPIAAPALATQTRIAPPEGEVPKTHEKGRKTIVALKTNLLYDAVTALNAEIEVPIGKQFSIMVEDVFPWWNWGPNGNKYCFQMWEMGVEPRWWFKRTDARDCLSGHFLGVYGMASKYDFQWDTAACYQGEYWSAGLSYGYAMPIARWLNLEFSLSVGFMQSDWRHYQPDSGYEHLYRDPLRTGRLSYFGPTKAKISLVIPISIKYGK